MSQMLNQLAFPYLENQLYIWCHLFLVELEEVRLRHERATIDPALL
jgi:hypothetical protein